MPKPPKKRVAKDNPSTPKAEHIFPQTQLTPLVLRWKDLNARGKHIEAMLLLDDIIAQSTAMFERLAQHEEYTNTVQLGGLVTAAQEKVVKWIMAWDPKKGTKLFSYFSKCAKNAFLSELVKETAWKKKNYTPGENLEKFHGVEDHESDKHNMTEEFNESLKELFCRWGSQQEIGALRYLCDCMVHDLDNHDKQAAIRGAAFAWGISLDLSKFFYSWVLVALRDLHYNKARIPFTQEDLIRHWLSYTNFVNLYEKFTHEQIMWLIATHGGQRFKIPTISQLTKLKEDYQIMEEVVRSDKDPESVARIAKKHKRTPRSAQEAFQAMVETTNSSRSGEYPVYGIDDPGYDQHG